MRVCIDPGHGGIDSGAVGNGYYEKDLVLSISLELKRILISRGIDVVLTRESDMTLDPNPRTTAVKSFNPDICLSIHLNAANGAGRGCETIYQHSDDDSKRLAEIILSEISNLGIRRRRAYFKLSNVNLNNDYYFMLRQTRPIPSVIVECLFIDNKEDMDIIIESNGIIKLAEAIALGTEKYINNIQPLKISIMGAAKAPAEQMEEYVHKINNDAPFLAKVYIDEGASEGVRGDLAFAQAIHETNFFRFGGDVSSTQNNFAGLGATGSGAKGTSFKSPREGIRAQIQHLKAYASTDLLNNPTIDPRFNLVTRGSAPNIEDLNGKWAVPGIGYGEKIVDILNDILDISTDRWWEKYFRNLSKLKIVEDFHYYNDNPNWGEFAAALYKTLIVLNRIGAIKKYTNRVRVLILKSFSNGMQNHWSKPYFESLYSIGILEESHKPIDKITWGELVAGTVKLLNYILYNDPTKGMNISSEDHWAKVYFDVLLRLGIIENEHDYSESPRWGEFAALLLKTVNYIKNV